MLVAARTLDIILVAATLINSTLMLLIQTLNANRDDVTLNKYIYIYINKIISTQWVIGRIFRHQARSQ